MLTIDVAAEADLPELLTLMRGYCDFYEVEPSDEALLTMSRALIADPAREGMQLLARDARGSGAAAELIEACADRCRERGITELDWTTAHDNLRAQKLYDRVGARRDERWLDYSFAVSPGATSPDS